MHSHKPEWQGTVVEAYAQAACVPGQYWRLIACHGLRSALRHLLIIRS